MDSQVSDQWRQLGLPEELVAPLTASCEVLAPHVPAAGDPNGWVDLISAINSLLGCSQETDRMSYSAALCGLAFGYRDLLDGQRVLEVATMPSTRLESSADGGKTWRPSRLQEILEGGYTSQNPSLFEVMGHLLESEEHETKVTFTFMQRTDLEHGVFQAALVSCEWDDCVERATFGPWDYVMARADVTETRVIPREAFSALKVSLREIG